MKKLVLTLVMGVFAFGMSGFSVNNIQTSSNQDCAAAAWEYADSALNSGIYKRKGVSNEEIAYELMEDYYNANCV